MFITRLSGGHECDGWGQTPLTDPREVLSVIAGHMPRSHNDAGFWILTSDSTHLFGDHESPDGSTAEALFWNEEVCLTCQPYDAPGFIRNARQIIPCFACNPGNQLNLPVPEVLRCN